jgi:hypothetical protein
MTTNLDEHKTEFQRVMEYATERAVTDGVEEEVMAALFDVFDEVAQRREAGAGPCRD